MILREPEFTDWLLNAKTPSIRYQVLVDLLGLSATDPGVIQARQAIMADGPVPPILSRQSESGAWSAEHSYYTPKYVSTHWSLTLLSNQIIPKSEKVEREWLALLGEGYKLACRAAARKPLR